MEISEVTRLSTLLRLSNRILWLHKNAVNMLEILLLWDHDLHSKLDERPGKYKVLQISEDYCSSRSCCSGIVLGHPFPWQNRIALWWPFPALKGNHILVFWIWINAFWYGNDYKGTLLIYFGNFNRKYNLAHSRYKVRKRISIQIIQILTSTCAKVIRKVKRVPTLNCFLLVRSSWHLYFS